MNLNQTVPEHRPLRRASPSPLAVPIDDACRITGLGRTKIYELMAEGKLRSVSVGRRRLVIYESIKSLLEPACA